MTHPDGAITTFGYDKVGNRQSVTRKSAAGTVFSTTAYAYDSLNRLTDIVNQNASGGLVSKYHYVLRPDGKRQSVTESVPPAPDKLTSYTYDDSGKLTQEAGPYATIVYGYDNVGNRITRSVTGATTGGGTTLVIGSTGYAYDANDRITAQSGPGGMVNHSYDADGNETTVAGQVASYDFENHLVGLGSGATSYVYDADGNRVSVTSGGVATGYVVDTSLSYASVVEEYSGTTLANGTLAARYDYGDDLIRMDRGPVGSAVASYYLFDGLGSTRQLVNTGGTITDTWGYSAFGELVSHTGTTVNAFLFNAQQFDQPTGAYFLRARYYDQGNGRFLAQDPYSGSDSDPISLHRYLYASNDGVNNTDPTGRETLAGLSISTSIASSFASIKNSVDLDIYNTVSDAVQYGTGGAIINFGVGVALMGAAIIAPSVAKRLGRSVRKLGPALRRVTSALRAVIEEGCFVADTPIQVRNGHTRPIQQIKKGDFVQSRNAKTGRTEIKKVSRTFVHVVHSLVVLTLIGNISGVPVAAITATPNHPFFVQGKGFTKAGYLHIGDALVTRLGSPVFVSGISRRHSAKGYQVYNFEVADDHTYFVGNPKGGIWVHNRCLGDALDEAKVAAGITEDALLVDEFVVGSRPGAGLFGDSSKYVKSDRVSGYGEYYEYLLPGDRRRIISHHYYNEAGEFDPHIHAGQPPPGLPEPGQPGYDEKAYAGFDFREKDYVSVQGGKKHFDYDERPGSDEEIAPWFQKNLFQKGPD